MRVLVTGANGFIGANLVAALLAAGHAVICAVRDVAATARRFPQCEVISADFNRDVLVETWVTRLQNVDAVINCAGVLRGSRKQSIENIHFNTPRALFIACVQAKVQSVIQISALGIEENKHSEYSRTKLAGDALLLELPLNAVVLRPSLVVAPGSYGGTSLFRGLAALPGMIPIIGDGRQLMQPIAMEDLAHSVVGLLAAKEMPKKVVNVVGPEIVSMPDLLVQWRSWLGLAPAKIVSVPLWMIRCVANIGEFFGGPVNKTSFKMMQQPNISDYGTFRSLIDFTPLTFAEILARHPSYVQDRWQARLYFLRPLLIFSIGLLWVLSGLLPLFGDHQAAFEWMGQLGVPREWNSQVLYSVAIFDVSVGLATWCRWHFQRLGQMQLLIIGLYTLLATIATPSLWLNLYGPILKNIPIAAAILVMIVLEDER